MLRVPVVQVPVSLREARWVAGRPAVLGVLAVALAVLGIVGIRLASAGAVDPVQVVADRGGGSARDPAGASPGTTTAAPGDGEAAGGPDAGADSRAAGGGGSSPPAGGWGAGAPASATAGASRGASGAGVVVHVVGQVVRPGVVTLPAGSRVEDAVRAAGGATGRADTAALNLARVLVDGEQVWVPRPGETPPVAAGAGPGVGGAGAGGAGAGGGRTGGAGAGSLGAGGGGGAGGAPVSINTADLAALDTLPGVGPVLAQRIVDWRTEHGRFTTVDELGEVSGIGEKLLAQLRPKVTL